MKAPSAPFAIGTQNGTPHALLNNLPYNGAYTDRVRGAEYIGDRREQLRSRRSCCEERCSRYVWGQTEHLYIEQEDVGVTVQ